MADEDTQLTAEDLLTLYHGVGEKKFVSDFDEIVKRLHSISVKKRRVNSARGIASTAGFSEPGRDSYLVFSCSCGLTFTSDLQKVS